MTITRQRPALAPYKTLTEEDVRLILNMVQRGQTNNGGTVTLADNADTTTLNDPLITKNSVIHFTPKTENAKAEGTPYYDEATDLSPGSVVLHHTNSAQTDRHYTFTVHC